MIRAKLISATNLMLEHPLLSPVAESEFFVVGVKEQTKQLRRQFLLGVQLGFTLGTLLALILLILRHIQ